MIFGSKYYIKRLNEDLGKFDARSNEGIFLGYAYTKKAYIRYHLRLHKIIESVDVKVYDLKTKKFKHQESILNDKSEDDEDPVGT